MRLGYNTNGLAACDAVDAIELLSAIGYRSIAITLDHGVLNPFDASLGDQLARTAAALQARDLRCVVETGARFLLDPQVKHEPTLVSPDPDGRARRVDFLRRAIDVAAALEADCVSLWSGIVRDGAGDRAAMDRLVGGLAEVIDHAGRQDVVIGFEPEPGMLIDTMQRYGDLLEEVESRSIDAARLRLTLDVGHLHCLGELPIAAKIHQWADRLANVHIEDMRSGIHEHLMFGDGEMDIPPLIAALAQIGYAGQVNVELSRHAHVGLAAAQQAFDFLRPLCDAAEPGAPHSHTDSECPNT